MFLANVFQATVFFLLCFLVFWTLGFLLTELFFRKIPDVELARITLEDRVQGVFTRQGPSFDLVGGSVDLPFTLSRLSAVPDFCLPLLTHLVPSELVAFLGYEDGPRSTFLRSHPPTKAQRIASLRLLPSSRIDEMTGVLMVHLLPWNHGSVLGMTQARAIDAMSRSAGCHEVS